MRIPRWQKFDPAVRTFDVECECGEEFRVQVDVEAAKSQPDRGFLVPVSGRCPWCGLRLEEIEPFAEVPVPRRQS